MFESKKAFQKNYFLSFNQIFFLSVFQMPLFAINSMEIATESSKFHRIRMFLLKGIAYVEKIYYHSITFVSIQTNANSRIEKDSLYSKLFSHLIAFARKF